jgi:hypothetical protein
VGGAGFAAVLTVMDEAGEEAREKCQHLAIKKEKHMARKQL